MQVGIIKNITKENVFDVVSSFLQKLKAAKVWDTAEFVDQMVQRDYVLQDGDVVELQI